MTTNERRWAELPAEVVEKVRPHLPRIVDEVINAVGSEVSAYQRPIEGDFGRGLRGGVEAALGKFLEPPGDAEGRGATDREVYVALGRGELQAGRSLEALLSAYRVGARVAFRSIAELARDAGLDADSVVPLAVATFAYIDELSAASIEGYAAEASTRAGERDRLRRELMTLILSGTADSSVVQDAAAAAGWVVPDLVVPVFVDASRADGLAVHLGPDALVAPGGEGVVALLPAPKREAQWTTLRAQFVGRSAVVGLVAPWAETATGLRPAILAMRLVADGVLKGDPLVVGDHLVDLIVQRDAQLAQALIKRELQPLEAARDSTRERLAETLLAWLSLRGERARIAESLHVHPQTVAYRLGQLRELFGDALNDPDRRFAIELALRAEAATS
jgi:hypothetical protein